MKKCLLLCLLTVILFSGCKTTEVKTPEVNITGFSLDEALARDLSDEQVYEVFKNQFNIRIAGGRFHAVLDILPVCVQRLSIDDSYKIVSVLFSELLKQKKFDDLERLADYIQNMFPNRVGLQELCVAAEIHYLVDVANLDKAVSMLIAQSMDLSDQNMRNIVRRLLSKAQTKRDLELMNRICEFVVSKTHGRPMTLDTVAITWVMLAKSQNKVDLTASRLSSLLAARAEPVSVARAYTLISSDIFMLSDDKVMAQMMQVGRSLMSVLSDKTKRRDVALLMFDYSCIIEDYQASIDLLKICHEGEKYDHLLNKILAHKALKEGRPDEAIKRFRSFMDIVKTWKTRQYDSSTGETIPASAVLGLNARRIGDILLSMEKKKEATAAYAEAKGYYLKSLGDLRRAPRWKADIEKAIKDLGEK